MACLSSAAKMRIISTVSFIVAICGFVWAINARIRSAKNISSWWWCMTENPPEIVFLLWFQNTDNEPAFEQE